MSITIDDVLAAAEEIRNDEIEAKKAAARKVSTTTVVHMYVDQKMRISQIAKATGLNRSTVYRRLEKAKVYTGPGVSGPARKDECDEGHDMAEWGVEIPKEKGGGRYCRLCKRKRDRESWRRRNKKRREAAA